MYRTRMIIIGIVVILFGAGAAQFIFPRPAKSPTLPASAGEQNASTTTANISATTAVNISKKPTEHPLSLSEGDIVASWDFKGAYSDNSELTAKAQSEIARLSELLATATSSAMILSVGVANQYELLGDGKKQYEYLERAIQTNPENGLPWHNLGALMERLGAYKTARVAYEKSTLVQPELKFYHYAYVEFLTSRMKEDTATIEKALENAEKNIGKTPYLLELRTEWQKP